MHTHPAMGESSSSGLDGQYRSDIHDFHELLRTGDREGLQSALSSPEFYRLACDDERYLAIAMQGVAVVAWDAPELASEFLVRFDVNRSREDEHSAARQACRALLAALEWRHLVARTSLPMEKMTYLRDFLRVQPVASFDSEPGGALLEDMEGSPQLYLDFLDELGRHSKGLPQWFKTIGLQTSGPQTVPNSSRVSEEPCADLSPCQISAMSVTITELHEALGRGMSSYLLGASLLIPLIFLPVALGALLVLVATAAFFTLREGTSYDSIVRPRLTKLAVQHGVGPRDLVPWLYKLGRSAGRVSHLDNKIENDHALDMLAALSSAAGAGRG